MQKLAIFFGLFFCSMFLHAQESIVIRGLVVDAVTMKPLVKASIVYKEKDIVSITDKDGKFSIECKDCKIDISKITISFIGYETKELTINTLSSSMEVRIRLKPVDKGLGAITVNPDLLPYIFFGSPQSQVLDYVFFQSGWLIALYNYHEDKTSIIYLGKSKSVLFEKEFPNKNFENFYVSCNGRYYAESGNEIIELFLSYTGIDFKPVDFDFFNKTIKYYAGTKGKYFYITEFLNQNLIQGFFLDNTETKKIEEQPFASVLREQDLILLTASEDRVAFKEGIANIDASHGVYTKISNPYAGSALTANWMILDKLVKENEIKQTKFAEQAYQSTKFKEVFAPFYVMDSSLVIVNYYQNIIERHAFDGKFIDTINLKIANDKRESKQTFYDTFSKKTYYRSESVDTAQSIYELNIANGESKEKRKISRSDIYDVKVSNGYVYYLFNPPKTNKVFLFREKIDE